MSQRDEQLDRLFRELQEIRNELPQIKASLYELTHKVNHLTDTSSLSSSCSSPPPKTSRPTSSSSSDSSRAQSIQRSHGFVFKKKERPNLRLLILVVILCLCIAALPIWLYQDSNNEPPRSPFLAERTEL